MLAINIIFIIIGVFFALLGFLVFKFKMIEILAGYDEKKVIDKDGLARWTGSNLILMGIGVVVSSVICDIADINSVFFFVSIVLLIVMRIIIGNRRYEKK